MKTKKSIEIPEAFNASAVKQIRSLEKRGYTRIEINEWSMDANGDTELAALVHKPKKVRGYRITTKGKRTIYYSQYKANSMEGLEGLPKWMF